MDVHDFIKKREKDWARLQELMRYRQGRRALSAKEVKELGVLYRTVTSDLAIARRDYPKQRVTQFLNQLLTQVHGYIYQEDTSDYRRFIRYFTQVIPHAYRRLGWFTLAAFMMFIIPAILGYVLTYRSPEVGDTLGLKEQREILANQSTWTDIPVNERPYASSFIMTNNIRVAILAFGGGVSLGLFTFYVLTMNGVHIGAIMGLAAHYGQGGVLWDFVIAHGVVELSVIFMAGGAGLYLGWSLLAPGIHSRRDALGLAARQSIPLVMLSIVLLVGAGLIEGFISPSDLSSLTKVLVGVGYGAAMYAYVLLVGWERKATAHPRRR
jgi:uncharacterized membrane protein SpoIIM required for sporulation